MLECFPTYLGANPGSVQGSTPPALSHAGVAALLKPLLVPLPMEPGNTESQLC